jgi:5S rRNA maturation endonuclease (ribonuclease M5)
MGDTLMEEMEEIEKEKVLIVEGNDDEKFIIAFLQHENIKDVQVINLGG